MNTDALAQYCWPTLAVMAVGNRQAQRLTWLEPVAVELGVVLEKVVVGDLCVLGDVPAGVALANAQRRLVGCT